MSEVANILENATKRSLLILDEIGRGTSTYDGLSIAWAVIEYINDRARLGARTLFATHYHELTELEDRIHGVKNYCVSVRKRGEDITFLRKIQRGGADRSYGVEVAKLAGIPEQVIERARYILEELDKADINKSRKRREKPVDGQLDLFASSALSKNEREVLDELRMLDRQILLLWMLLTSFTPFSKNCGKIIILYSHFTDIKIRVYISLGKNMGKIVILDEKTANQIAAGEVIERPASVVKEMAENAIDAGADQITIEIRNGGISYIRVSDNGHGMEADDVELAFERHATSKIRRIEDLEGLSAWVSVEKPLLPLLRFPNLR